MRQRFVVAAAAASSSKRDDDGGGGGGGNIQSNRGGNGVGWDEKKEKKMKKKKNINKQDEQEQKEETSDISLSDDDDDSSHYKTKKKKKKDYKKKKSSLLLLRKRTLLDVFITVICLGCIYVMTYYQNHHNNNNNNNKKNNDAGAVGDSSSSSTSTSTLRPTRQQNPSSSLNSDNIMNKFDIIFFNKETTTATTSQQQQNHDHEDSNSNNIVYFVVRKPKPFSHILGLLDQKDEYLLEDYGDLTLGFFVEIDSFKRQIMYNPLVDSQLNTYVERSTAYTDDVFDRFYAFDDDFQKSDAITDYIHKPKYQPDYSHLIDRNVNSNNSNNDNEESELSDDSDDNNNGEPEVEVKWCRRTSQHRKNQQSCNLIHEIAFVPNQEERGAKYLTDGTYRQVFLIERTLLKNHSENIIVKDLHFWYNGTLEGKNYEYYEYVRVDAGVAEILTSSPYIFDIYGYCGLSILSEYFPHGDIESVLVMPLKEDDYDYEHEEEGGGEEEDVVEPRRRLDEEEEENAEEEEEEDESTTTAASTLRQPWRNPNKISLRNKKSEIMEDNIRNKQDGMIRPPNPNNLTPSEKLSIATQMALGVAELHGCEGGMIVHQDIQLHQFLFTADKSRVKLNDFNRAQFVLYDEKRNSYCKYFEGIGHGTWRSPEEYYNWPVNEKVDIFSLGNNFYAILTGKEPYWVGEHRAKDEKRNIKDGILPYIDPAYTLFGSKEEQLLVEIIQRCYEYKPNDRPSIFDIVKWLQRGYI